jgi:NAD(P)-dependent dehydrogenase (short-subunit alcohol dehydrogenase family)
MTFDLREFSLAGKTALVVGGSSGIGREIALGYAAVGARALIVGRDRAKLDRVAAEIDPDGRGDVAFSADMRAVDAIGALADEIEGKHGPVDILVNCQGTTTIKPALDLSEEEYDTILDTNLKSVFFCCTAFGRRMLTRRQGAIINIQSLAAHTGWGSAAAYSASKWGVAGLTQTLAAEWGVEGVRVNAISPGFFLTDLNRDKMPESRKREAVARSAMKRMGELPELVGTAVFLASDAARFINGATVRVDGGYLASGI